MATIASNPIFDIFLQDKRSKEAHQRNLELQKRSQVFGAGESTKQRALTELLAQRGEEGAAERQQAQLTQAQAQFEVSQPIVERRVAAYEEQIADMKAGTANRFQVQQSNLRAQEDTAFSSGLMQEAQEGDIGASKTVSGAWRKPTPNEELTAQQRKAQVALGEATAVSARNFARSEAQFVNTQTSEMLLNALGPNTSPAMRGYLEALPQSTLPLAQVQQGLAMVAGKDLPLTVFQDLAGQAAREYQGAIKEFGQDSPQAKEALVGAQTAASQFRNMAQSFSTSASVIRPPSGATINALAREEGVGLLGRWVDGRANVINAGPLGSDASYKAQLKVIDTLQGQLEGNQITRLRSAAAERNLKAKEPDIWRQLFSNQVGGGFQTPTVSGQEQLVSEAQPLGESPISLDRWQGAPENTTQALRMQESLLATQSEQELARFFAASGDTDDESMSQLRGLAASGALKTRLMDIEDVSGSRGLISRLRRKYPEIFQLTGPQEATGLSKQRGIVETLLNK